MSKTAAFRLEEEAKEDQGTRGEETKDPTPTSTEAVPQPPTFSAPPGRWDIPQTAAMKEIQQPMACKVKELEADLNPKYVPVPLGLSAFAPAPPGLEMERPCKVHMSEMLLVR